jgi:hypothetical protein
LSPLCYVNVTGALSFKSFGEDMSNFSNLLFVIFLMALSLTCQASGLSKYRCDIRPGMTVEEFKSRYFISEEPELMITDKNRPKHITDQILLRMNKKYYRFKEYGIWAFFSMSGELTTVRFDRPFRGAVGGVYIGDSKKDIVRINGMPDSDDENGIRYRSPGYYLKYETIREKVVRVFTNRCDEI